MKLWLACSLFALAQASCYDYEYYDPGTGASLGNACGGSPGAAPGAAGGASVGQPLTPPGATVSKTTTLSTSTQLSAAPAAAIGSFPQAPVYTAPAVYGGPVAAPAVYGAPAAVYGAPAAVYGAPAPAVYSTPAVYGAVAAPVVPATVYGATPVATSTARAVQVTSAGRPAASSQSQLSKSEVQHLEQVGQEDAQQHQRNSRRVRQATQDIQRGSIFNRLIAGAGATTSWFPLYRLGQQKNEEQAYRSEDRIAARDANIAYQQYQQHPTQLNLLVSKYQDLNADLHDAAHHYNVVNSGTFGQAIGSGLLGGLSSKLLIPQIVTQKSENNDLQGIQRRMKRVARQIQGTVQQQRASSGQAAPQQNTVQQRMMALSVYGPNRG